MGTLLAGIFGIALILLVLGLGWHTVWSGLTVGAEKARATIVSAIGYFLPGQQGSSSNIVHGNVHGLGLNKV